MFWAQNFPPTKSMQNPSIHGISKFYSDTTGSILSDAIFFHFIKMVIQFWLYFSVDDYPIYDPKFFKMIQEEAHRRHEAMKADKECDKNLYIRYVTQKWVIFMNHLFKPSIWVILYDQLNMGHQVKRAIKNFIIFFVKPIQLVVAKI